MTKKTNLFKKIIIIKIHDVNLNNLGVMHSAGMREISSFFALIDLSLL